MDEKPTIIQTMDDLKSPRMKTLKKGLNSLLKFFFFFLLEILVKKDPFWTSVKKPPSHFGQVVLNLSIVIGPCIF